MMNKSAILYMCLVLSGCVSVDYTKTPPQPDVDITPFKEKGKLTNIKHVYKGMTKQNVEQIMGDRVTIGYRINNVVSGAHEPIYLDNPYKVETIKTEDKSYEVYYYLTQIMIADGKISDNELTPLVFEDSILIGKGTNELSKIKNE